MATRTPTSKKAITEDVQVAVRRGLAHLKRRDPDLAPVIRRHGAPEFARTKNAFESLVRAIVYQQLSGKAAGTIYGRFRALSPGPHPKPATVLSIPDATLRGVGLSTAKARYVKALAAAFDAGTVKSARFGRMSDDEIVAALTPIAGVGRWTVDMFLMFSMARMDVLPVGDLGVQKGMQAHFGLRDLPGPADMVRLAAPWAPYRSIGSWYMWRVIEGDKSS